VCKTCVTIMEGFEDSSYDSNGMVEECLYNSNGMV